MRAAVQIWTVITEFYENIKPVQGHHNNDAASSLIALLYIDPESG